MLEFGGVRRVSVTTALSQMCRRMNDQGLTTHEECLGDDDTELLGCHLSTPERRTDLTAKRYWRLDRGIRWLLRRRSWNGRLLECILGHCTFAALVTRGVLSVFHAVYAFISEHYVVQVEPWPTVVAEMQCFLRLLPHPRGGLVATLEWPRAPERCLRVWLGRLWRSLRIGPGC